MVVVVVVVVDGLKRKTGNFATAINPIETLLPLYTASLNQSFLSGGYPEEFGRFLGKR